MDAPTAPGWYFIVYKDSPDQTSKVRARWDGTHFRPADAPDAVPASDVDTWEPIVDDQPGSPTQSAG